MVLSYTCRILCLSLCGAGLLQILLQALSSVASGLPLSAVTLCTSRIRERIVFATALAVGLAPYLLMAGLFLPAYIRSEDNLEPERVGLLSITAALLVLFCILANLVRVALALLRSARLLRACPPVGETTGGIPLRLAPGTHPTLAVAGVLSPAILISQPLLDELRFPAPALEAALAHEAVHAAQHDNLKLLLLELLPHITLRSSSRPLLQRHWRLCAELAADANAAGRPGGERAILLAGMLLSCARETAGNRYFPSLALVARSSDLRIRVEHLLADEQPASRPTRSRSICSLLLAGGAAPALLYASVHHAHRIAEFVLHLGS